MPSFVWRRRRMEPMVLRAHAGECIVVRLRNLLRHAVDAAR